MESIGFYFFGVFYALHQSKIPLKEEDLSCPCGVSQEKDGLQTGLARARGCLAVMERTAPLCWREMAHDGVRGRGACGQLMRDFDCQAEGLDSSCGQWELVQRLSVGRQGKSQCRKNN